MFLGHSGWEQTYLRAGPAHVGAAQKPMEGPCYCVRCTESLDRGLAAQALVDIKMQSSRNRPWREWKESSALTAPFADHKNWSRGFVSVILTDSPT